MSDSGDGFARRPQVALDAGGNALVVWEQSSNSTRIRARRHVAASAAWGPITLLQDDAGSDGLVPSLAVDGKGRGWAGWWQASGILANRFR